GSPTWYTQRARSKREGRHCGDSPRPSITRLLAPLFESQLRAQLVQPRARILPRGFVLEHVALVLMHDREAIPRERGVQQLEAVLDVVVLHVPAALLVLGLAHIHDLPLVHGLVDHPRALLDALAGDVGQILPEEIRARDADARHRTVALGRTVGRTTNH